MEDRPGTQLTGTVHPPREARGPHSWSVEPLDLTDDRACTEAYLVTVASRAHERPWAEPSTAAEELLEWRHVDEAEPHELWTAVDPIGTVVGLMAMWFPQDDNTTMSWFDLEVHPARRCRGAGGALLEQVVLRAEQEGRTTLITEMKVPEHSDGHPYRRFLERRGFTLNNTELIRHLDLPVDPARLDRLEQESRPWWDGSYRIETFAGLVPEALLPSLCAVMNQLAVDAPSGEVDFEEESLTPARMRQTVELELAQGRQRLTTLAIHEASGAVVAYTDLVVPADGARVWQYGTLVHRDHRGHRLGMAIKVQNLRRLQADHPTRKRVITGNDDTNSFMLSINERLGFRVVELCPAYRRKLG